MTSREKILDAAISVFARKGRYGAHVEDIAACARINKAMIYYIFSSKDELYFEVLKNVAGAAFHSLSSIKAFEEGNTDVNEYTVILSNYISELVRFLYKYPQYDKILIDALSNGSEEIAVITDSFRNNSFVPAANLRMFFEQGKKTGIIRDIDTNHLIISTMSMIMGSTLFMPFYRVLDIKINDEKFFLEERAKNICDLLLKSIFIGYNASANEAHG